MPASTDRPSLVPLYIHPLETDPQLLLQWRDKAPNVRFFVRHSATLDLLDIFYVNSDITISHLSITRNEGREQSLIDRIIVLLQHHGVITEATACHTQLLECQAIISQYTDDAPLPTSCRESSMSFFHSQAALRYQMFLVMLKNWNQALAKMMAVSSI